jgi:hypothetical protein
MATPRKLDQEKQREVAVAYLCGVKPEIIGEKYDVSDATIRGNIIGKYSREWNDPLVEHLRETPGRDRARNSASVYLSSRGRNIYYTDLIDGTPEAVTDIVKEHIYDPEIEKIIEETSLNLYVETSENHEKLLDNICWGFNSYSIVNKLLLGKLEERYQDYNQKFSLSEIFGEVKDEVVKGVKKGGLSCTPKKRELIDYVLGSLEDTEEKVIRLRFGLYDNSIMSPDEVSQDLQIDRKEVKQIEDKALRRLSHPYNSNVLKGLIGLVTDRQAEEHLDMIKAQRERHEWRDELYSEIKESVLNEVSKSLGQLKDLERRREDYLSSRRDITVDELELSVRTANCLNNLGFRTIKELLEYTPEELLKTKKIGRKSLRELNEIMKDFGLTFF